MASVTDWSALQICVPDSILPLAVFQDGAVTLKTEYQEALRGLQWSHGSHVGFSNRGTRRRKLTVCVFPWPLPENTSFTISVKIFWWTLQRKYGYDIFNFMLELSSCAQVPTLTLDVGKPCLRFISGWFLATWEDTLYKVETRFRSPFTVFFVYIPVHNRVKPSLHWFEFTSA